MPIKGVTHDSDGKPLVRRAVTTKVAIGLPPQGNSNHPTRLDHFIFLEKIAGAKGEMAWAPDKEMNEHYKPNCKEFWAILLDNDVDQIFRTEYAAYVKTGKWCQGDGDQAKRKDQAGDWKPYTPCANQGCKDLDERRCAPSGDLYFMLADFPALGNICRIHTSSYQSIREVYSSLQDLKQVSGGRLMGLKVKLTVRPEKNVYDNDKGQRVTGTKHVLGMEIPGDNLQQIADRMLETAQVFQGIQRQLAGHVLEIEDDDEERAAEISEEFLPVTAIGKAPTIEGKPAVNPRVLELFAKLDLNQARRDAALQKYAGRDSELIQKLETMAATSRPPEQQKPQEAPKEPPPEVRQAPAAKSGWVF